MYSFLCHSMRPHEHCFLADLLDDVFGARFYLVFVDNLVGSLVIELVGQPLSCDIMHVV